MGAVCTPEARSLLNGLTLEPWRTSVPVVVIDPIEALIPD